MKCHKYDLEKLVEKLLILYPGLLEYVNGINVVDNICFQDTRISQNSLLIENYTYHPHEVSFHSNTRNIFLLMSLDQTDGYILFPSYQELEFDTRVALHDNNIDIIYTNKYGYIEYYETESIVRFKTINDIITDE